MGVTLEFSDVFDKHFSRYVLRSFLNENHFLSDLDRLPSGRFRALKWRSSAGKNSFIRNAINFFEQIFKFLILAPNCM